MATRPLAKALHTVTSTARVARYLMQCDTERGTDIHYTLAALAVLGYSLGQIDQDGPLFAACVAAVGRV